MTFYAFSSMTQKVIIDWFLWALAEWCRMIKGGLSSIIRKICQWSLRSQRSNNHYKRTVPKLLPLYLLKFLTNFFHFQTQPSWKHSTPHYQSPLKSVNNLLSYWGNSLKSIFLIRIWPLWPWPLTKFSEYRT